MFYLRRHVKQFVKPLIVVAQLATLFTGELLLLKNSKSPPPPKTEYSFECFCEKEHQFLIQNYAYLLGKTKNDE